MVYVNELRRICDELAKRRDDLDDELSTLPEGELYIYDNNGLRHYYQRFPKGGNRKKEHRMGIKKNPELLSLLVRKKYVTSALELLNKDIEAVEKMLKKFRPTDENSVMKKFVEKYPELEERIHYGRENYEDWAKAFKEESDYHSEYLTSTASDGTKRRSLGEIIIGSKLEHYNIPFRYEAPAHPDLPYMPDFTIIRPRDGKIIYWEHFGKVTDAEYMKSNRVKLDKYEEYNIVPWENLIISYSQADGGINEKLIDALIQGWLL